MWRNGDSVMAYNEKIGNNIRALRNACGETQQELGDAVGVAYNTISYYEKGERQPDHEMLTAISRHYSVTVDDLMHSDFTTIGKINFDYTYTWKNIDLILPIIESEQALKDEYFKRANKYHHELYDMLKRVDDHSLNVWGQCIDQYAKAAENEVIGAEVCANILSLLYIMLSGMKTAPEVLKTKPALLLQNKKNNRKAKHILDNLDPDFEKDAREALLEFSDPESKEQMSEMLLALKESKRYSDLAYYYIAFKYIWGIVDNDMSLEFNGRVGIEMMEALIALKNPYAINFFLFAKGIKKESWVKGRK